MDTFEKKIVACAGMLLALMISILLILTISNMVEIKNETQLLNVIYNNLIELVEIDKYDAWGDKTFHTSTIRNIMKKPKITFKVFITNPNGTRTEIE